LLFKFHGFPIKPFGNDELRAGAVWTNMHQKVLGKLQKKTA